MKKSFLLSVLFVLAFLGNLNAQNIEKEIVGKWKLVDLKWVDASLKPIKVTPAMKKELADAKKMFMSETALAFEFKDGKMNAIPAEGESKPYKINGKFLDVETSSESEELPMKNVPVNIVKGNLEMAPIPAEDGKMMMMIFKKQ